MHEYAASTIRDRNANGVLYHGFLPRRIKGSLRKKCAGAVMNAPKVGMSSRRFTYLMSLYASLAQSGGLPLKRASLTRREYRFGRRNQGVRFSGARAKIAFARLE